MGDSHQLLLGVLAVGIMVGVPILCVVAYDLAVGRFDDFVYRFRQQHVESSEHRREVRALRRQRGVPIERVAADLRRLRGVIAVEGHSAAHHLGNRLAYDRVLAQACTMLDIQHALAEATVGMERDIERLRVEAELERAGLILSIPPRYGKAA